MPHFRPCRHLFTDGHQCGSPALRGEELCFYHHSTRRPIKQEVLHGRTCATLPEPLDLHAVQRGLAELLRLSAAEAIDLKLAALLHRQLASASQNLARIDRAEARANARAEALGQTRAPITDYTNHPTLGTIAVETENASEASVEVPASPADVQTQTQPNEDFETSQPMPADSPEAAPRVPAAQTEPVPNRPSIQAPLPDPIARFTLAPAPEYVQSQADSARAHQAFTECYLKLAQGIHNRAEARAKHHAALFPLEDAECRRQDEEDLEYDSRLAQLVHTLQQDRAEQAPAGQTAASV